MSPPQPPPLPIDDAIPALRDALRRGSSAVLDAPPGAGKTTRVPLALLGEPWLGAARIVMLEPRRIAARAAARRMAWSLGEGVGETVGYRVRGDTRVGPGTRVEVVTEGVLTRMLQHDATLDGTGLVIFDEFHERSLHADLGLALVLETQEHLRPELRILVMSATLDGGRVAGLLGGAPVVESRGRVFPVETRWAARRPEPRVEPAVAATVRHALADAPSGDVLVFLPGAAEIGRVARLLGESPLPHDTSVVPLYGDLAPDAQDRAIRPAPPGTRKVVLATSVAETSLTIEGVRVVVDAGLARVPRFSPRTGMTRLETVRVSRASADQRRGRAGREAPGVCWRLWPEADDAGLVPFAAPEITEADLAGLALELLAAGVRDPAMLRWLDPPPPAAYAQAVELLAELGAVDDAGAVTPHGRAMAELPAHPRLAHLALVARSSGSGALAADLLALLGDRDPFRGGPGAPPDADVRLRVEAVRGRGPAPAGSHDAVRRVRAEAGEWRRRLGVRGDEGGHADDAGALLVLAYPDRVARRRAGGGGRYLLRNGRGARLGEGQSAATSEWLAIAELDGAGAEGVIRLAAPVTEAEVRAALGDQVVREEVIAWDDAAGAVTAVRRERLGAIVLREGAAHEPDEARVTAAFMEGVRRAGIAALPWSARAAGIRQRLAFLARLEPGAWPDVSDASLGASLDMWLAPRVGGLRRLSDLARLDLGDVLLDLVPWDGRRRLDELAPTHLTVPSGSRLPLDYGEPDAPRLAVRLQELFGLGETPRVGGGRVPVTLLLLSPAQRPVQVTRDLGGFWRGSYADVRKDLRGRYPKHHWPDDPLAAPPTARAKRRGE